MEAYLLRRDSSSSSSSVPVVNTTSERQSPATNEHLNSSKSGNGRDSPGGHTQSILDSSFTMTETFTINPHSPRGIGNSDTSIIGANVPPPIRTHPTDCQNCRTVDANSPFLARLGIKSYRPTAEFDKGVYPRSIPSLLGRQRVSFAQDVAKKAVWFSHPSFCGGWHTRGSIKYCDSAKRWFFTNMCIKHAGLSKYLCRPFHEGIDPDNPPVDDSPGDDKGYSPRVFGSKRKFDDRALCGSLSSPSKSLTPTPASSTSGTFTDPNQGARPQNPGVVQTPTAMDDDTGSDFFQKAYFKILEEKKAWRHQVSELDGFNDRLNERLGSLEANKTQITNILKNERTKHAQLILSDARKRKVLEDKIGDLERRIGDLENSKSQAEKRLSSEIDRHRKESTIADDTIQSLKIRMDEDSKKLIESLRKEREMRDLLESTEKKTSPLQTSLQDIKLEHEKCRHLIETAVIDREAAQKMLGDAQSKIEELCQVNEKAEEERHEAALSLWEAETELASLRKGKQIAQTEKNEIQASLEEARSEVERLRENLDLAEKDRRQVQKSFEGVKIELEKLKETKGGMTETEQRELQTRYNNATSEMLLLRESLEDALVEAKHVNAKRKRSNQYWSEGLLDLITGFTERSATGEF
ncbi:uncharacterized protein I206_102418 [Kwoniella pini CBS 10737]|uniref:Uncharacterized protein n=1 Tax=Kwoniella pini CBS 10737 TaxID=1296096 RepID=A0A1B9I5A9_9TREE|nr:uncharacterized protein I206_02765 [Kwoniella pini CBS 10737]OCF50709.1 hypothetical protein I206_02765 [Kwoniella pini CBS 10737]